MTEEPQPTDNIRTPRLRLRSLQASDAEAIARFAGDWDVARMTARIPHPYTVDDALAFIAERGDELRYAVVLEATLVGCIGARATESGQFEIGYWIGKPYWGRGIATEAASALIRELQSKWPERAIVAGHASDNPASQRVLEKLGFRRTGQGRRWSVAREQELTCILYELPGTMRD
jgi:RimJ/RimL family protein N-acetyltransferase